MLFQTNSYVEMSESSDSDSDSSSSSEPDDEVKILQSE